VYSDSVDKGSVCATAIVRTSAEAEDEVLEASAARLVNLGTFAVLDDMALLEQGPRGPLLESFFVQTSMTTGLTDNEQATAGSILNWTSFNLTEWVQTNQEELQVARCVMCVRMCVDA
jgi:hypothetical protein